MTARDRRAHEHRTGIIAVAVAALLVVPLNPPIGSTVAAASNGPVTRVTPVHAGTRDMSPLWVTNDRLAYVRQSIVVEPDRWLVDSNLHEVNIDGTDDWTGPVVATEFDAMYDYSPVTETYVYLKDRYRSPDPSQFSIGVTGPDGVEKVVSGHGLPNFEALTAAGDKFIYYAPWPGVGTGVHMANSDGSSPVNLEISGGVSLSPDGTRIVYITGHAHMLDLVTGERHTIAQGSGSLVFGSEVSWSPDGSVIATAGELGIVFLDPDATAARTECDASGCYQVPATGRPPLVVTTESVSSPAWSPDGSRLAVTRSFTTATGYDDEIAIVNADGTDFHDVTDVPGSAIRPAWSPDGTRIAFDSDMDSGPGGLPDVSFSIYVLDLDGTPADGFVTAVGTQLELDGQPFTFTGMNIYNANSDDWCANNMDNGKLETALAHIGLGGVHGGDHGVIRAWFFQPLATQQFTGARDWTRFDRTLAAARDAGYYVIPTLGNQWGECGHKGPTAGYKGIDWYQTGYTQLQPEDSVYATYASYRDWVAEVVARYRDDPTILAWQLLNEAETSPVWPQACPPGPEPFDAINGWATDVSAMVKELDPNHLVSLGTIGSGQCGTSGPDYKALHAIPTIDLCEFHDYDPWTPMPGDQWNGLALRIQQCGELGKPLFIGEVGLRPVDVGGSFDSRVASLRAKLQAQRAAGIVGHLVWNWGPGLPALDSYDIGPGDLVVTLLANGPAFADPVTPVDSDWVAPTITFGSPTRSLYTLNEPVAASYSCIDVGTAGLASCVGTLPDGSPIDTSAPGSFSFTVTATDALGNNRSVSKTYQVTAGGISTEVPPGTQATVTTDPGGLGPSVAVPIQTTVQFEAPAGAPTPVSIDLHPPDLSAPAGYAILGNQVDIDVGGLVRPASDPIVITFVVDSSTGADPATIAVARTNADDSTDIAEPCTAPPVADPDPCLVAAWVAGPGSDVLVTVYTTHASPWLVLRPRAPELQLAKVKPKPGTAVKRGSTISVGFELRDAASSALIPDEAAMSIASSCSAIVLFSGGDPSPNCFAYDPTLDLFSFDLKTSKSLTPGAHEITIRVSSGPDVVAATTIDVAIRK